MRGTSHGLRGVDGRGCAVCGEAEPQYEEQLYPPVHEKLLSICYCASTYTGEYCNSNEMMEYIGLEDTVMIKVEFDFRSSYQSIFSSSYPDVGINHRSHTQNSGSQNEFWTEFWETMLMGNTTEDLENVVILPWLWHSLPEE